MTALMWEVRAAAGRLEELVAFADAAADPSALVFCSAEPEPRVVVIDPTGHGMPDVPAELVARPPHSWPFDAVPRVAHRPAGQDSSERGGRKGRRTGPG
jgi:hypothetical protein